jgi:hypothetical protein
LKTAELAKGLVYAVKERTTDSYPGLLLEKGLWREKDEWGNWNGAEKRFKARIVRRAPQGARAEGYKGWGRDYEKTGLPVLLLKATEWDFSKHARDNQIIESPLEILERARDNMGVMALVAEDYDGRSTDTKRKSVTLQVQTVKGVAREVVIELELVRPQQVLSQWGPYVKAQTREREARQNHQAENARLKAENDADAARIKELADILLGQESSTYLNGERYDLHRRSAYSISTTYEISQDSLMRLLELAEKGLSA